MRHADTLIIQTQPGVKRTEDEEYLIARAKKNPGDFEVLYRKYYKQIFRFIHYRINDKEITADVTSQVFLNALSNLKSYESRGLPFSSWLYRIAYNQCMMHFRSKSAERFIIIDDLAYRQLADNLIATDDETPPDIGPLKAAFMKLKETEVELLELRFYEGHSFKVIGEILGITENNAKVKTYRTIDRLKKLMK